MKASPSTYKDTPSPASLVKVKDSAPRIPPTEAFAATSKPIPVALLKVNLSEILAVVLTVRAFIVASPVLMLLIVTRPELLRAVGAAEPVGSDEINITVFGAF